MKVVKGQYELMDFPLDVHAVIIDTDLPVTEHFTNSLCAFSTGFIQNPNVSTWSERFFREVKGSNICNPFVKNSVLVKDYKGRGIHCCPWPTSGYIHDGIVEHLDLKTNKTIGRRVISEEEILERFTWPAHMSMAMFFKKELHYLAFSLLERRAREIAKFYPNQYFGIIHNITSMRQVAL